MPVLFDAKRMFDIAWALSGIAVTAPLTGVMVGLLSSSSRDALGRTRRMGLDGRFFDEYRFEVPEGALGGLLERFGVDRLPVLWNILRGDMSFVGPRAVYPGELGPLTSRQRRRFEVRPGLVCLWWVRQQANIDYDSEVEADLEYVDHHGIRVDLAIALRAALASVLAGARPVSVGRVGLLGVSIDNVTMEEAVQAVAEMARFGKGHQVCFVNADCANAACVDQEYMDVLRGADRVFADGIGVRIAGKLLGWEVRQNVNGTDLFPRLCRALSSFGARVYLLGGAPGVAEGAAAWVSKHYPRLVIAGTHDGYFGAEGSADVVRGIADSGADVLLVGMGVPLQDKWIRSNLQATGVRVAAGVGGLLDFYSGRIPRAPMWVRELGSEWVYRFFREPRRLGKRYLVGNLTFLSRVLRERRAKAKPPTV